MIQNNVVFMMMMMMIIIIMIIIIIIITVMHNKDNNITIMWDMPVNTDRTITANRPDTIVKDSVNFTCKLIDMTVPADRNIALKETEKKASTKT